MAAHGRPTKLTPEIQQRIVMYIEAGNYIETAALCAGIAKSSLYLWLQKAKGQKRGIYRRFSDAIEKATAKAEARDNQVITKAAIDGQWQAAAWRLERKFPDKYGRKERMDLNHSGSVGVKIVDDVPNGEPANEASTIDDDIT